MLSRKHNKLRNEKRKAKRIVRSSVAKSHALRGMPDKYPELKYKGDIVLKKKPLSFRQRMMKKLQKISFRNIFKK